MPSPLRLKRNQEKKERTRALLLAAAAELFARKGYHRTLISDIVAAAGVGQGTFYRFFDSKRSLFMTLLDEFFGDLIDEFSPMSANLPTSLDEYRDASISAVRRAAHKLDSNREMAQMFLREAPSIDREADDKLATLFDRFAQVAQFYLDHAIERGFARPCNSQVVAQALVGIGIRLMHRWFDRRFPDQSLEDLSREAIEFAFTGFGTDQTHSSISPPVGGEDATAKKESTGHGRLEGQARTDNRRGRRDRVVHGT